MSRSKTARRAGSASTKFIRNFVKSNCEALEKRRLFASAIAADAPDWSTIRGDLPPFSGDLQATVTGHTFYVRNGGNTTATRAQAVDNTSMALTFDHALALATTDGDQIRIYDDDGNSATPVIIRTAGLTLTNIAHQITIEPNLSSTEVWFKGSNVVLRSAFTQTSGIWKSTSVLASETTGGIDSRNIADIMPESGHLDMVFVNNESLRQRMPGTTLEDNEFSFNPVNHELSIKSSYLDANSGALIEIASDDHALSVYRNSSSATADRSKFIGLNFTHYLDSGVSISSLMNGNPSGSDAIQFLDCTFAWNALNGLRINNQSGSSYYQIPLLVDNCTFVANGKNGLVAGGLYNSTITDSTFSYNNVEDFTATFEAAGAKISRSDKLTIASNYFEYNYANGLWLDVNCQDFTIIRNVARYNLGDAPRDGNKAYNGIMIETCGNVTDFTNNTATQNSSVKEYVAFNLCYGQIFGAGIYISESYGTQVFNNTLSWNNVNFRMSEDYSADSPEIVDNIVFHNNALVHAFAFEISATGSDHTLANADSWMLNDNSFDNNGVYDNVSANYIEWDNQTSSPPTGTSLLIGASAHPAYNATSTNPFANRTTGEYVPASGTFTSTTQTEIPYTEVYQLISATGVVTSNMTIASSFFSNTTGSPPHPTPSFFGTLPVSYSNTDLSTEAKTYVTVASGSVTKSSFSYGRLVVVMGSGNDTLTANINAGVVLFANLGDGNDVLQPGGSGGIVGPVVAFGGAGTDILSGGSGSDYLNGNSSADTLNSSDGTATASNLGTAGDDYLFGEDGNDSIAGGAGDDTLIGGDQSDALIGGTDNDLYWFEDAAASESDTVTELSSEGRDTIDFSQVTSNVTIAMNSSSIASSTNRTVTVAGTGAAAGNFENATGGSGNDTITGNSANGNLLSGNGGNDLLNGLDGSDTLYGGDDDDVLNGGIAADFLYGDGGNDTLYANSSSTMTSDSATDLLVGGAGTADVGYATTGSPDNDVFSSDIETQYVV